MRRVRWLIALALWLVPALAAAQMPTPPERRAEPTLRDIAYAPAMPATSKGHLLDLYLPRGDGGLHPLVIWTSGSAFLGDNGKEGARFMAPDLLAAGFAVAGVSVRSSNQTTFPGNLHDIKAAIRFLRSHAAQYGIDPGRIAIMGDSSGGWTAAMAVVTGDVPALEGDIGTTGVSSAVQAGIAFYPPTDFLVMDSWAPRSCSAGTPLPNAGFCHDSPGSPESLLVGCAIQSCPDKARAADPVRYVSAADPPLMILHGRADPLVPYNQGERLFKALVHNCNTAVFYTLPLAVHGPSWDFLTSDTVRAGASVEAMAHQDCALAPPRVETPGWPAVIAFLNQSLGVSAP